MVLPKYIRIQGRQTAWVTQKPVGVFGLGWRAVKNNIFSDADKEKFIQADKWFDDKLPYPPFYGKRNDDATANTDGAITYFKNNENADRMLEGLMPILDLLDKYKIPYDIIYTNHVGKIIYEDDFQVGVV
jgi:hypothetical protein